MIKRAFDIWRRELKLFSKRPMMLTLLFVAPIILLVFFTSLMSEGLPKDLPIGVIDEDNTQVTRTVVRTLDAMEQTGITQYYASVSEARDAMQRGEIYAFLHIPSGTTEQALGQRQPKIAFYTNQSYLVAGSLLMRDLRTASELAGLGISRQTFLAKGMTDEQAMAAIRPIVVEAHPVGNSVLDYSVYLSNIVVPGALLIFVLLFTSYTLGLEWKYDKQKKLYQMAGENSAYAVMLKLMPQTVVFSLMILLYDVVFYRYLGFPLHCPLWEIWAAGVLTIMAAQAFATFVFGLLQGSMRMAMSVCSLWGIVSISLSGCSFPVMAMDPILQAASWLFPLRHYYLIYVNIALHGWPIISVWPSIVALLCFMLLPILSLPMMSHAFRHAVYKP
ncbi:MAG: ABC transporter permease [Bacteroidales bacterium]|nr:ABC transporter permease [Bacteroidales bacterium]MBD5282235.1 ABC transporter permease [Bacteroides sp.]MBD5342449.1 ABC transporter permease [Bacteroides sp.]MBD5372939.1 ABC transporter permease [Bacteroides sp.]